MDVESGDPILAVDEDEWLSPGHYFSYNFWNWGEDDAFGGIRLNYDFIVRRGLRSKRFL